MQLNKYLPESAPTNEGFALHTRVFRDISISCFDNDVFFTCMFYSVPIIIIIDTQSGPARH